MSNITKQQKEILQKFDNDEINFRQMSQQGGKREDIPRNYRRTAITNTLKELGKAVFSISVCILAGWIDPLLAVFCASWVLGVCLRKMENYACQRKKSR